MRPFGLSQQLWGLGLSLLRLALHKLLVNGHLVKVVGAQDDGEVSVGEALDAEDDFVLCRAQGRVLSIHIVHDLLDLLGVQGSSMLEPYDTAALATEVAQWPKFLGEALQHFRILLVVGLGDQQPVEFEHVQLF